MQSIRPSLQWFAARIENELCENDHKGGWKKCTHSWLLSRLKEEVAELEEALQKPDNQEHVISEAADVAAFAMMIADLAGELHGE